MAINQRDAFDILDSDLGDIQGTVIEHIERRILEGAMVASVVNGQVIIHARQDVITQPCLQYA